MSGNAVPRVLLVDDDRSVLDAFVRTLKVAGFTDLHAYCSWSEAASLMAKTAIHVLLLDILMPEVSGRVALAEALKLQPAVAVIMVTGVNDVATAVECMKSGASDYLTKPVSGQVLVEAIRSVLVMRKILGRPEPPRQRSSKQMSDLLERVESFHPARLAVPPGVLPEDRLLADKLVRYLVRPDTYPNPSLTLASVAVAIDTNTAYLSRVVNRAWGMNFRSVLNRLRVAAFLESCQAGSLTDASIEGVARSLGYARPATFYSAFKSILGATPSRHLAGVKNGGGAAP